MSLHSLPIAETLRSLLIELESYLGIKLDREVIDDVFADVVCGSLAFKYYTFYSCSNFFWPNWTIEGAVDEDEPAIIWLQSRGGFRKQKQFEAFFKNRT